MRKKVYLSRSMREKTCTSIVVCEQKVIPNKRYTSIVACEKKVYLYRRKRKKMCTSVAVGEKNVYLYLSMRTKGVPLS